MRFLLRLLPFAAGLVATALLGAATSGFAAYYYLKPTLPSVAEMREIQLQIPLRIYSRDGRLITQVGEKRRTPVSYDEIPEVVVQAFLAAEDDRFFQHPGFDYQGILRAGIILVTTGSRAQGGSTITQQLAREYFLTRDRTFVRKAKELILATQIENAFEKPEILALYLNKIFLGQRSYGVAAAAEVYFGKNLSELNVAEAATIAGLPAAPSKYNPVSNPMLAQDRRGYVLRRMHELRFIDDEAYETALATPMESFLHAPEVDLKAPYVAEMARSDILKRFGPSAYIDGYQVITTVDSRLQRAAGRGLRTALLEYDRRHGYRGPLANINAQTVLSAYVDELKSAAAAGSGAPVTMKADSPATLDAALQAQLRKYANYSELEVAVVLATEPKSNSAELFVRNIGRLPLSWDRIRWKKYINDNVVGSEPNSVSDILKVGDVVYILRTVNGWQLAQVPLAQGAFVAVDPADGATLAMTGGFEFNDSKFNRAVQAIRQPGSSFKPFIYSAALDNGFTPATIVNDAPIVVDNTGQEEAWRPENYSNRFYGPTRLREGLVRSMNLVSLRILQKVGIRRALNHIKPFDFPDSALPRDLSLALGSGGTSPLHIAEGFAGFASGGYDVDPYVVDKILDAQGNVVFQAEPKMVCEPCADVWYDGRGGTGNRARNKSADSSGGEPDLLAEVPNYRSSEEMMRQAGDWRPDFAETPEFWADRNPAQRIVSKQNAFIVYDMMRDVIQRGTGRRARDLGRTDIAGKTGTSNNRRDAWFSGYNNDVVGIAWVGFDDDGRSLGAGEEGSRTALPMWKYFMETALAGTEDASLPQPEGIVSVRISPTTGLAAAAGEAAIFEIFKQDSEPKAIAETEEFGDSEIFLSEESPESIF